eukprot:Protomagalhaensia_sp_Gyna_25__2953@NODE_2736_length_919_cov_183_760227_g2282_i0_p1_GENE_NODE_2736_length_919_cov_183_760227_g2282_i0NODE_2736_length_919_cov_183_760227_g2282_i0_p1_ORF_typecomplete_len104_score13_71PP2C/PF00481_21/2_7e15SpoIIE/PF07228_12/0_0011PP2C_2/PF13672_6/0_14_NODE_2736_length_919_cov_183_760227_g2282_i0577888
MMDSSVSRAFGDRRHKENDLVIVKPEVKQVFLEPEKQFAMVVASDGIWDVLDEAQVIRIIQPFYPERPREAASAVVTSAYEIGSMDNMTCVVIFFSPMKTATT